MATTYTVKSGETLNSIAKQFGFTNYKEAGVSSVPSGNFDLVRVGDVITLGNVKTPAPTTPAAVTDPASASAFINSNQENDIQTASASDAPPTRKSASETLTDAYKQLTGKSSLLPDTGKPTLPNYEATFNELRSKYNVDQLEGTLNDLNTEEQSIRQAQKERAAAEEAKPVALGVIQGRITEEERQTNQRLESISIQKAGLASQLQTANSVIQTTMNLKQLDYSAAKSDYDSQFSQNLQMFGVIKGLYDADVTEEERISDNARSNLQIIYSNLKESGDTADITPDLQYTIEKLELEAGLPTGFYSRITAQQPDAKILSTTTRTTNGVKYADVLTKNADGSLSTQTVKLGTTTEDSGDGNLTEAELIRGARSSVVKALDPVRGADGYVSPDNYKKARNAWISSGLARKDFDDAFADEYVNPESYEAVGYRPY